VDLIHNSCGECVGVQGRKSVLVSPWSPQEGKEILNASHSMKGDEVRKRFNDLRPIQPVVPLALSALGPAFRYLGFFLLSAHLPMIS